MSIAKTKLILPLLAVLLTSCGFSRPQQVRLDEVMPAVTVTGDRHSYFYKITVSKLRALGISVCDEAAGSCSTENEVPVPVLVLPAPYVTDRTVSVDSKAQAIEKSLQISVSPVLNIPNHRPIRMSNSVTRSMLNKTGDVLASDREMATLVEETLQNLSDQLVQRLSYLGRYTDPDASVPQPAELLSARGEPNDFTYDPAELEGLTLLEALQLQEHDEKDAGKSVDFSEINNGNRILEHKLPPVKPIPLHQAPAHF